jgi:hypothetical protein
MPEYIEVRESGMNDLSAHVDSALTAYTLPSEQSQHVFFQTDLGLIEFYSTGVDRGRPADLKWHWGLRTMVGELPDVPLAPHLGPYPMSPTPLASYVTQNSVQHVFYFANRDSHLWELYWSKEEGKSGEWNAKDVYTNLADGADLPGWLLFGETNVGLHAYVMPDGSEHVIVGLNEFYRPTAGAQWQWNTFATARDENGNPGRPPAMGFGDFAAFVEPSEPSQHIVYATEEGSHVIDLAWTNQTGWQWRDMTATVFPGSPPTAPIDPATGAIDMSYGVSAIAGYALPYSSGELGARAAYVGATGDVYGLRWYEQLGWRYRDLTADVSETVMMGGLPGHGRITVTIGPNGAYGPSLIGCVTPSEPTQHALYLAGNGSDGFTPTIIDMHSTGNQPWTWDAHSLGGAPVASTLAAYVSLAAPLIPPTFEGLGGNPQPTPPDNALHVLYLGENTDGSAPDNVDVFRLSSYAPGQWDVRDLTSVASEAK